MRKTTGRGTLVYLGTTHKEEDGKGRSKKQISKARCQRTAGKQWILVSPYLLYASRLLHTVLPRLPITVKGTASNGRNGRIRNGCFFFFWFRHLHRFTLTYVIKKKVQSKTKTLVHYKETSTSEVSDAPLLLLLLSVPFFWAEVVCRVLFLSLSVEQRSAFAHSLCNCCWNTLWM